MKPEIIKTQGIALRIIEVSNTSAIVVWLTRDNGRLATMIKGAYRPKSMLLGQFDLFYTCELLYYAHAREHLHSIRECSPIKTRYMLREDWRACVAAAYKCDLVARIVPWESPVNRIYNLLDDHLDALDKRGLQFSALFWFELRILNLLGFSPRLSDCAACGIKVDLRSQGKIFSDEHGGLVCSNCVQRGGESVRQISNSTLAILRQWQTSTDVGMAERTRLSDAQIRELERLLGGFMRYHLEHAFESRNVAFSTIRSTEMKNKS